jgi:DNA-binding response OmpR family regulator
MKHILAVDDDPDILDILAEVLEGEGYFVERATSVKEGEEYLDSKHPHLILLDLHLPDKNGSYLARRIKQAAHTQHIPIILFSSHNELEQAAEAVQADSYLAKPFDLTELVAKVDKFLLLEQ